MNLSFSGALSFILLFVTFSTTTAQQTAEFVLFTPDTEVNKKLAGRPISDIDYLIYAEGPSGLTIDPVLPADWTWFAGKGITSAGRRVEFIFSDGHVYATSVEVCAFRNRKYPDIITDDITANTFTIGMRKFDETLIFVATEEAKQVDLRINKRVFGVEKRLQFHLGNNESTLIRIFPHDPPYRP